MIARAPLFPGDDYLDQIQRVIAVLGTPTSEDMEYISNPAAKRYIKALPKKSAVNWLEVHPDANPVALDLLGKMVVFNPENRFTIQE
jgi:mitogen-activated protein kinase 1/3